MSTTISAPHLRSLAISQSAIDQWAAGVRVSKVPYTIDVYRCVPSLTASNYLVT